MATALFTIYEDERVTYEANFRAVATLAARLREMGVGKGDRVALAMRNLPEWPVVFFAAASIGAIVVPLNAWWTGGELEYGLADSGAKLLFVDDERHRAAARRMMPSCRRSSRSSSRARPSRSTAGHRGSRTLIGTPHDYATLPDDAAARGGDRARRRCDDLLHQRHHRQAQGRARHASQHDDQHPVERLYRGARAACAAARRRPAPTPRVDAARSSRCSMSPPAARR